MEDYLKVGVVEKHVRLFVQLRPRKKDNKCLKENFKHLFILFFIQFLFIQSK